MAQFMLLLYNEPSEFAGLEPQEFQKVLSEYQAWGQKMASRGKLVSGHKLKDEGGRHLEARGKEVLVTDGPFAEAKEVLGGYYLVDAASYDEAVELAKTGPHLRYNGRIEIREIEALE
ncbi:MAG TPA: YciI family protein [Vicinamibacteria bacterium]|nr:YciI family protein [Vicinamibacteria bacterium]